MSVAANIIGIGLHDLPAIVSAQLQHIGKMDKITKNLTIQLSKEENQLLETLKSVAKYDPAFNEEPLKEAAANISKRRLIVSQMIEKQTKSLQSIYDHLDKKISYFENILKNHAPHLHSEFSSNGNAETQQPKRKKKKVQEDPIMSEIEKFEEAISSAAVDPNEPLYCSCKRISFGNMIACENLDCTVEWFHFTCVGILCDMPPDNWYCPECRTLPVATTAST